MKLESFSSLWTWRNCWTLKGTNVQYQAESEPLNPINTSPVPCALGADGRLPGPGSWHHHHRYRDGCERRPGDPALPERPSVPRHLPGVLHVPVWHLPQDGLAQLTRGREHLQLQRNQWATADCSDHTVVLQWTVCPLCLWWFPNRTASHLFYITLKIQALNIRPEWFRYSSCLAAAAP